MDDIIFCTMDLSSFFCRIFSTAFTLLGYKTDIYTPKEMKKASLLLKDIHKMLLYIETTPATGWKLTGRVEISKNTSAMSRGFPY